MKLSTKIRLVLRSIMNAIKQPFKYGYSLRKILTDGEIDELQLDRIYDVLMREQIYFNPAKSSRVGALSILVQTINRKNTLGNDLVDAQLAMRRVAYAARSNDMEEIKNIVSGAEPKKRFTFDKDMLVEFESIKSLCLKNGLSVSRTEQFLRDAIHASEIMEACYGAHVQYEKDMSSVTDIAERLTHQWAQSITLYHEFLDSYDIMRSKFVDMKLNINNANHIVDEYIASCKAGSVEPNFDIVQLKGIVSNLNSILNSEDI